MAVGEWITLKLQRSATQATASSSDPKVIRAEGNAPSFVRDERPHASFHALRTGSALLSLGYVTCPSDTSEPCSYQVRVVVVQFPKADVTIRNVFEQSFVHLRVGQVARFFAPYPSSQPWSVTIDDPRILDWAVEPIYPQRSLEAAVVAKSPGTAHVQGDPCQGPEPVCANPWRLTFSVADQGT